MHSKNQVFAWLLLVDRLNTKAMLLRRHFHVQPNTFCVMCISSTKEDKILIIYSFSALLRPHAGRSLEYIGQLQTMSVIEFS